MLKFFLISLVLFLGIRLAFRLVARLIRGGIFFMNRRGFDNPRSSSAPRSSPEHLDEADYEVIESHLKDNNDSGHSSG